MGFTSFLCSKCTTCAVHWLRLRSSIKADTKPLEILSGLWFFVLFFYVHDSHPDHMSGVILPALDIIAPEWVWKAAFVFVGAYQIGAVAYGKVWCRKLASLFSAMVWSAIAAGLFLVAGNVPSVGLMAATSLGMCVAALGLYEDEHAAALV